MFYYLSLYACMLQSPVEVRGQFVRVSSFIPPQGPQGSTSDHQVLGQAPLPTEPSQQPHDAQFKELFGDACLFRVYGGWCAGDIRFSRATLEGYCPGSVMADFYRGSGIRRGHLVNRRSSGEGQKKDCDVFLTGLWRKNSGSQSQLAHPLLGQLSTLKPRDYC